MVNNKTKIVQSSFYLHHFQVRKLLQLGWYEISATSNNTKYRYYKYLFHSEASFSCSGHTRVPRGQIKPIKTLLQKTGLAYGECYQNIFRGILIRNDRKKTWAIDKYTTSPRDKPTQSDQSYGYPIRVHHCVEVLEVSTWHRSVSWRYIYKIQANHPQTRTRDDAYYSASVSRSRPRSYLSSLPWASNHLSAAKPTG